MPLSKDLISQFVKMTNDNKTEKKESTVYGTVNIKNGAVYVHIDGSFENDGSKILTPIPYDPGLSTTIVKDNDRVSLMIKNHTAVITGNLSSPAPRNSDVPDAEVINTQVTNLELLIADKVSTEELSAERNRIDNLYSDNIIIHQSLTTISTNINKLKEDNATIKESLTANSADIEKLKATTLHSILPDRTDLNTVTVPNTYIGKDVVSAQYLNVPFESGTFVLEVTESGPEGQLRQTINICHKERIEKWIRFYDSDSWGKWIDTTRFDGTILWSGGLHMEENQIVTLSEKVSKQRNGIVLVFSEYLEGAVSDTSFTCHFIPKEIVSLKSGCGHIFVLSSSNLETVGVKHLYINDNSISGNNNNIETGTASSGIAYSNNKFVMRYVIGI